MTNRKRMFGHDIAIPADVEIEGPVVKCGDYPTDDRDPKLNRWLDEADRLARLHDDYYFNPWLGYPKYDNGLDQLFPEYSPQEALDWWVKYEPEEDA